MKKGKISINKDSSCRIFHADLWGLRDDKYQTFQKSDITKSPWEILHPQSPFHLFIPQDTSLLKEYEKWLKDRKGRRLFEEDINHYQRIVVSLKETVRIMEDIDEVIEQHSGWPGAFQ